MRADKIKVQRRNRRKRGIRKRVHGTQERPRLTVYRSHNHIYAQVIDDDRGITLCSASSQCKDLRGDLKHGRDCEAAKAVGTALAARAKAKQVEAVCFDRSGYRFHGRVKSLADAAREGGLKF